MRPIFLSLFIICFAISPVWATDLPSSSYIFPAGGQRGTTVDVRIGAHYMHASAPLRLVGQGVKASESIRQIDRIWFEGPMIRKPFSQRAEDYPKDHQATFEIAEDAPLGLCFWQVWTSQGAVAGRPFVIGDLPELVEEEIDGTPIPTLIELPVTVNGRVFPREDVDIWSFDATAGQVITCSVNAARIESPLDARLEVRGPDGARIVENDDHFGADPLVRFRAEVDGRYEVRIHDINYLGFQNYVYRLTIRAGKYIDHVFPLGAKQNSTTNFHFYGAELDGLTQAIQIGGNDDLQLRYLHFDDGIRSNLFAVAAGHHDEINEAGAPELIELDRGLILNGQIKEANEVDRWRLQAAPETPVTFELKAASLGSSLDAVVVVRDPQQDANLLETGSTTVERVEPGGTFTIPPGGEVELTVRHVESGFGGAEYAYRISLVPNARPEFKLLLPSDSLTLFRGESVKLPVNVKRIAGYDKAIQLSVENLPAGVTIEEGMIPADKSDGGLTLKAAETARIQGVPIRVVGQPVVVDSSEEATEEEATEEEATEEEATEEEATEEEATEEEATEESLPRVVAVMNQKMSEPVRDEVLLAVAVRTPFTLAGDQYRIEYAHRGSLHSRPFVVDRGGYEGPLQISLADRQARHLQGVSGGEMRVAPDQSEFSYSIQIPTRLELNRTGRIVVMAVGELIDEEGHKHKVSFSAISSNDQIIILTSPMKTGVDVSPKHVVVQPDSSTALNITVKRGQVAPQPIIVELIVPQHFSGIMAEPITIPAGSDQGTLQVQMTNPSGPFNMPMTVRATTHDSDGLPLFSESKLEVIRKSDNASR